MSAQPIASPRVKTQLGVWHPAAVDSAVDPAAPYGRHRDGTPLDREGRRSPLGLTSSGRRVRRRGRRGGYIPWHGHAHRQARAIMLATRGTVCAICGHPGATEAGHVIPARQAPQSDDPLVLVGNLRPVHGTSCPCPTCGRRCNQEQGRRLMDSPGQWATPVHRW